MNSTERELLTAMHLRSVCLRSGEQPNHLRAALAAGIASDELRLNLLVLLSVMRMRVPAVKQHLSKMLEATVRKISLRLERAGQLPKPPPGMEEILSVKNLRIRILNWKCLQMMFKLGLNSEMVGHFERMRATLLQAPFGTRFMTSDQPVALFHPTLWNSTYGVGPGTDGVEISFPLSSRYLLLLDHGMGSHAERTATLQDVEEFNRRTIEMAQLYVYTGEAPSKLQVRLRAQGELRPGFHFDELSPGGQYFQVHRCISVRPSHPQDVQQVVAVDT